MPKCFTSWTVLPHDAIEKHAENLWSVSGKMPGGNQRRMTLARRSDGTLLIHNAIALNDEGMSELEAFGKPAYLVVPNGFHRMDSVIYKQRYPRLTVLAPAGARKKVAQLLTVDGHLDEMPKDEQVEAFHLRGMKQREGVVRVKSASGTGVVFNDTLLNVAPQGGFGGFFMAPTGSLSVPRFLRWVMMKSGAELKEHLNELAATAGLSHVIPGHGDVVMEEARAQLQKAAARL